MKHTIFYVCFCLVFWLTQFNAIAQQGPVYGYIPDDQAYLNSLPVMQLSAASAATTLPAEVDNSQQIFFPRLDNNGLYDQTGT